MAMMGMTGTEFAAITIRPLRQPQANNFFEKYPKKVEKYPKKVSVCNFFRVLS